MRPRVLCHPFLTAVTVGGVMSAVLAAPAAAHQVSPHQVSPQRGQPLEWVGCPGIANQALRCASVKVPLDYANPRGRWITIAISRLPATDPAQRRGVLLTTGGGPGGPGVPLPDAYSGTLDQRILAQYDLIGFDLRFVERSTPISCGRPAEEPGGWWGRDDEFTPFDQAAADAAEYARDCARTAGWALPHATTANGARDMDRIRAALGESKISYLGGSYAAMLGAGYASMFPNRVDRFVLDSPPDYTTVWRGFEVNRTGGMEDNYFAFMDWMAARDSEFHLGTSRGDVSDGIAELMHRANNGQLVVAGRSWTMDEVGSLIVGAVFFEEYWSYYAPGLAALVAGRPLPFEYELRPTPLPGTPGIPADNHTALGTAYRCADGTWSRDLDTYRRDLAEYRSRYPVYGPMNADVTPCAFWAVPTGADRIRFGTDRAPGTLVLSATHDASVPLANAIATARALKGSRLVTIDLRTHGPFVNGFANPCLSRATNDYLVHGQLPETDLAC